jgi:hypothetical protein
MAIDPIVRGMLREYVKSITIESNVNEPYTIVDPFAEKPESKSVVGEALKPRIDIEMGAGIDRVVIAPFGNPNREERDRNKKLLIGGGVIASIGLLLLGRRKKTL